MGCEDSRYATPRIGEAYGRPVPSRLKAVVVRAGTRPVVRWTMVDSRGCPADLTDCLVPVGEPDPIDPAAEPAEPPSPDAASAPPIPPLPRGTRPPGAQRALPVALVPVYLRLVENTILGRDPDFPALCTDPAAGTVECRLDLAQVGGPGIYIAEMAVLAADLETVVLSNPFTLVVERGLFAGEPTGLPTLAEIRLRLRDSPQANELLGDFAWDDAEIAQALQEPIDFWNAELPDVGVYYTSQTFPAQYRYWWVRGTIAALFRVAAEHQRRNQFDYSAGGVQVQDSNRSQEYYQAAEEAWNSFAAWVRSRKVALNNEMGWGIC